MRSQVIACQVEEKGKAFKCKLAGDSSQRREEKLWHSEEEGEGWYKARSDR